MITDLLPEVVDVPFSFRDRGTAIPADRRPLWRIAMISAVLKQCSRGARSSIVRLHVLDWSFRNIDGQSALLRFLDGEPSLRLVSVRFDPALLRALRFGCAMNILALEGANVTLSTQGQVFADAILSDRGVFSNLRPFMDNIGKRLTEAKTKLFLKGASV